MVREILVCLTCLLAGFMLFSGRCEAAIYNAASAKKSDVLAAIGLASDGDTVIVPAGTASWTSPLLITKGITLQGATTVVGSDPASFTVTDKTIILDDIVRASGSNPILSVSVSPSQAARVTGLTFRKGGLTTLQSNGGVILTGTSTTPNLRLDHCHFDSLSYQAENIHIDGALLGVVDHCVFDLITNIQAIVVWHNTWTGGADTYGDGSWTNPAYWGTEKFFFFETNRINSLTTNPSVFGMDEKRGARVVTRYNYFYNCPGVSTHGTESGGRGRGPRANEFYRNRVQYSSTAVLGQVRAGSAYYWGNTGVNWNTNGLQLAIYREGCPFDPWGAASGNNPWDSNDPNGLYRSDVDDGRVTSVGTGTMTVAGASWTINQWAGYSLTNPDITFTLGGTSYNASANIISNTSNQITFYYSNGYSTGLFFNANNHWKLYKLNAALDQAGHGAGDLLTGDPPVNSRTGTVAYPNQATEASRSWGNRLDNGTVISLYTVYPTIQENRDFYIEKTSFNGKQGIGVGLLSARPTTCTTGVAYWATDQGEWDSTNGATPDGQLYVATATNTWSLSYTPYTYPHPLVSGSIPSPTPTPSPTPDAPQNLMIVPGG